LGTGQAQGRQRREALNERRGRGDALRG
jgi:hypothetical protein